MKKYLLFLLLVPMVTAYSQKKCKKYAEYFDIGSKCIECGDNYTVEEKPDGSCVEKWYHKGKKNEIVTIRYITFKSAKEGIKHGLFFIRSEDNKEVERGMFKDDIKEGQWTHVVDGTGLYRKGLKEGAWSLMKEDSSFVFQHKYLHGQKHGEQHYYDASGVLRRSELFLFGEQNGTKPYDTIQYTGKVAGYPCSEKELGGVTSEVECSNYKLGYQLFSKVRYPKELLENGILGEVVLDLIIDQNGKALGCEILSSTSPLFSQNILDSCTKIDPMQPAYQYDLPIASRIQMPMKFKPSLKVVTTRSFDY